MNREDLADFLQCTGNEWSPWDLEDLRARPVTQCEEESHVCLMKPCGALQVWTGSQCKEGKLGIICKQLFTVGTYRVIITYTKIAEFEDKDRVPLMIRGSQGLVSSTFNCRNDLLSSFLLFFVFCFLLTVMYVLMGLNWYHIVRKKETQLQCQ